MIVQSLSMNTTRIMSVWQVGLVGLGGILGAILMGLLNFGVFDKLFIPDPCYYHSHDTNWLFDRFYDITSAQGGHPSPSMFNIVVTLATGLLLGGWLTIKGIKTWQKKQVSVIV